MTVRSTPIVSWLVAIHFAAASACFVDIPALGTDVADGGHDSGDDEPHSDVFDEDGGAGDADADVDADVGIEDVESGVCEAGTTLCGEGALAGCTDLTSDPSNCGQCGRSCLGADCVDGRCEPIVLASGIARPWMFVKDGEFLYGTAQHEQQDGGVWKLPVEGCDNGSDSCVEYLSYGVSYYSIAMDAESVYAVAAAAGLVEQLAKDGSDRCTIATGQTGVIGVAVDDTHVYWAFQNTIMRRTKGCASTDQPEVFVGSTPSPYVISRDDTGLYWASKVGVGVYWASSTGESEAVWSGTPATGNFMFGPATDDAWVYWREGWQSSNNGTARLVRAPMDRTGELEVLVDDQSSPRTPNMLNAT